MDLKGVIREISDFPKEGIGFKDLTTLFKNADALKEVVDRISEHFADKGITKVISLESRGFIVGGALAYKLHAGFVLVRKRGKLPSETFTQEYDLEYGKDILEIHSDAISVDDVVLIHDDLLATGGSAYAALELVRRFGVTRFYFSFICDLTFLNNEKKKLLSEYGYHTLVNY